MCKDENCNVCSYRSQCIAIFDEVIEASTEGDLDEEECHKVRTSFLNLKQCSLRQIVERDIILLRGV